MVHGGRVLEGLERLNRLSKERELLARGLSLVIAQRLLPRLCSACKVIDLSASRAAGASIHQAVGCPQCSHTGFRGRVLVEESLYFTAEVRDRFIRGTLTREFLVGKRYFQGLEESLQTAILDGLVDVKNAKKVVPFEHD